MFLTSPDFETMENIRHAFFTREKGVSEGVYASLNGGIGSADNPEYVHENRLRMAQSLGVLPGNFLSLYQIHSPEVVTVTQSWLSEQRPKADGMVTKEVGIALAIATADCGPVLFADSQNGVIGAAHAGWRGALVGILEATLAAMEAIGAEREQICAVLGPTITQVSYEVGRDFYDAFLGQDAFSESFFRKGHRESHFMFDLPGYILSRLQKYGLKSASFIGACTYSNPDQLYSYRRSLHRNESDYGRLISAICLTQ